VQRDEAGYQDYTSGAHQHHGHPGDNRNRKLIGVDRGAHAKSPSNRDFSAGDKEFRNDREHANGQGARGDPAMIDVSRGQPPENKAAIDQRLVSKLFRKPEPSLGG